MHGKRRPPCGNGGPLAGKNLDVYYVFVFVLARSSLVIKQTGRQVAFCFIRKCRQQRIEMSRISAVL